MESINIATSVFVAESDQDNETMRLECYFTPEFDDEEVDPISIDLNVCPSDRSESDCMMSVQMNANLSDEDKADFVESIACVLVEVARFVQHAIANHKLNVMDVCNMRVKHYNNDSAEITELVDVTPITQLLQSNLNLH